MNSNLKNSSYEKGPDPTVAEQTDARKLDLPPEIEGQTDFSTSFLQMRSAQPAPNGKTNAFQISQSNVMELGGASNRKIAQPVPLPHATFQNNNANTMSDALYQFQNRLSSIKNNQFPSNQPNASSQPQTSQPSPMMNLFQFQQKITEENTAKNSSSRNLAVPVANTSYTTLWRDFTVRVWLRRVMVWIGPASSLVYYL